MAKCCAGSRLVQELVHQSRLTYAWLAGNEDDLPLSPQRSPKILSQLAKRAMPPHEFDLCRSRRLGRLPRRVFANTSDDRSDKLVPTPGQSLNENRMLRVVTESVPNVQDVTFQNLGLNIGIGPDGIKEFVLRHQAARVIHEISKNGVSCRL
jgi:hypothetical protein